MQRDSALEAHDCLEPEGPRIVAVQQRQRALLQVSDDFVAHLAFDTPDLVRLAAGVAVPAWIRLPERADAEVRTCLPELLLCGQASRVVRDHVYVRKEVGCARRRRPG